MKIFLEALLRDRKLPSRPNAKAKTGWAKKMLLWRRQNRQDVVAIANTARRDRGRITGDEFEEDVIILRSYSFISVTADLASFEMHRLVQLATQKWLKSRGRLERWASQFVSNLDDAFPSGKYEEWAVCQPLLPHAMAALDMNLLDTEAKLWQASLLLKSGRYASQQGAFDSAERMQSLAMKVRKAVLPEGHPDTLTSMGNLVKMYSDQGRWAEAEKLQVEVMEMSKAVLPEGHPDTLRSMGNLAIIQRNLGRQESSVDLMRQCIALSSDRLGPRHPDTLGRCRK